MIQSPKETLKQALGAVCPFAFRNSQGSLSIYSNPQDAYKEVIVMLWAEFPRGFVDIPFFMSKYQGLSLKDAERLCGRKQYAIVKMWDRDDKQRIAILRRIYEALLRVSELKLNESYFLNAIQCFDIFVEKSKIAENTQSGAIVNFITNRSKL
ncbi:MAG: hypothetical protein IIV77_00025 [Bacteroidaceae bacterium]|nr:hypothetical protein [Bacteroidaceae bacterium]